MIRYEPVRLLDVLRCMHPVPRQWWRPLTGEGSITALVAATGADALLIALRSIERAGKVVVPAYTCDRVVSAILAAGDEPAFVDVEARTGTLQPQALLEALDAGAKAVIATPLFGLDLGREQVVTMSRRFGAAVIEDRAVCLPPPCDERVAPDYAVFSFGRGKPASLGSGGMVVAFGGAPLRTEVQRGSREIAVASPWGGYIKNCGPALKVSEAMARFRGNRLAAPSGTGSYVPLSRSVAGGPMNRAVANFVNAIDMRRLSDRVEESLDHYREAFRKAGVDELASSIGSRLTQGTVSPSLALLVSHRDDAIASLRRSGIDVPVYWRYSVGQDSLGRELPGASKLARELLFLPLHSQVGSREARMAAMKLRAHQPAPFS